jgi:hypothetical protein
MKKDEKKKGLSRSGVEKGSCKDEFWIGREIFQWQSEY